MPPANKQCCGNCTHSRMAQNVNQRICRGAPPSPVTVPTGTNQVQIQFFYPVLDAADEGCSLFRPKVISFTKSVDSPKPAA